MLDIKAIRKDAATLERRLKTKVEESDLSRVLELDSEIRELKQRVEILKAERNEASKKIGALKRSGEDASELIDQVSKHAEEIHGIDHQLQELVPAYTNELARQPNVPDEDVKVASDPAENVCLKEVGSKPAFSFEPKNHLELNENLNLFDFKRGAKVAGTGWPAYKGMGARLEWALINYMMDFHIQNGWTPWFPPLLSRPEGLFGSGQFPKFADQVFKVADDDYELYLIPTAEVALNGLHMNEILDEEELPLKYVSYTPCFRREAGAAGATERGLIRVHQFNKVEMFAFAKPDQSEAMFNDMVSNAEKLLDGLGIHYRVMLLVTGDMSFPAARTIDLEVWLPGQDRYYEVSSVSNCTDYQARRSQTRFRAKGEKPELLHTLNGSGLATSRLMVGLLENNQNPDGSVNIPPVLQKYLGGIECLTP